eukprot:scaffold53059_cov33-Phaeocystis_antarctica.AAC.3
MCGGGCGVVDHALTACIGCLRRCPGSCSSVGQLHRLGTGLVHLALPPVRRRPLLADGRGWQLRVVRLLEQHGTCLLARHFSCGHLGQQLGLLGRGDPGLAHCLAHALRLDPQPLLHSRRMRSDALADGVRVAAVRSLFKDALR